MSAQHIAIEPDEIDDLPAYQPSTSTSQPQQAYPSSSSTPQPGQQAFGRIANVAGEVASDRRYTGGDTLDEPVSTTIVLSLVSLGACNTIPFCPLFALWTPF